MKEPLRGIRFRTVPEILQAVDRSIRTINTTGAAKGILRLPHRWQRVVHNAGDYIEVHNLKEITVTKGHQVCFKLQVRNDETTSP